MEIEGKIMYTLSKMKHKLILKVIKEIYFIFFYNLLIFLGENSITYQKQMLKLISTIKCYCNKLFHCYKQLPQFSENQPCHKRCNSYYCNRVLLQQ